MASGIEIGATAIASAAASLLLAWVTWGNKLEGRLTAIETRLTDHRPSRLHDRINRLEQELEYLEPILKGLRENGAKAATAFFQQVERRSRSLDKEVEK